MRSRICRPVQWAFVKARLLNWATANGWDLKTLMAYVGWKNVQSAMRYVDASDPILPKIY